MPAMEEPSPQDRVFESAAELFSVLATPIRLKIILLTAHREDDIQDGLEKLGVQRILHKPVDPQAIQEAVSQLLGDIDTTQPNMSQHLATLYRSGVLAKRREGTQIYYRLQSERVATLCRAVCTQVAIELDGGQHLEQEQYDHNRTEFLQSKGYRVLRFWNHEVLSDLNGVARVILEALEAIQ